MMIVVRLPSMTVGKYLLILEKILFHHLAKKQNLKIQELIKLKIELFSLLKSPDKLFYTNFNHGNYIIN